MGFRMIKIKRIVNKKKDKLVRVKMMIQTNLHIDFSEMILKFISYKIIVKHH